MQMLGPHRYHLTFTPEEIIGVNGGENFIAPVAGPGPKLYIISSENTPIYVGQTIRRIRRRLNDGFNAIYGYQWRYLGEATIDIWTLEGGDAMALETVEGEVVFLIRQNSGQWPQYQTEIHFHQSNGTHRAAAQAILNHYGAPYAQPANQ